MTQTEALRLALKALEGVLDDSPKVLDASISGGLYEVVQCRDAITAIKAALKAKDEPYAFEASMYSNDRVKVDPVTGNVSIGTPQRTWVGLTDEEIARACGWSAHGWWTHPMPYEIKIAKAIEAKLKERNG